jgi:hypothetical protein
VSKYYEQSGDWKADASTPGRNNVKQVVRRDEDEGSGMRNGIRW